MTNKQLSTKQAAELIAADLINRYGWYTDCRPVIRKITDNNSYSIAWDGPEQWAMNDRYYLFEELKYNISDIIGSDDMQYDAVNYEPYFDIPDGFTVEPMTGCDLTIQRIDDFAGRN